MKKLLFFIILIGIFTSCHESLEERAAREAREYTEKCCPTPVVNYTRTDSVHFDIPTRTYIYYCTFVDMFDDFNIINQNRKELHDGLYENISTNAAMRQFVEAGFKFAYIVHSEKEPSKVLYNDTIVVK